MKPPTTGAFLSVATCRERNALFAFFVSCSLYMPCHVVTILMDYSNDSFSFFSTHLTAKATLESAAVDLGDLLTTPLGATSDMSAGTAPDGSSCTFDFNFDYPNPTTGARQIISNAVLPINQVRIFVGVRNLIGTASGTGGPGGTGLSASASFFTSAGLTTAVNNAQAAANANISRGGGPTIGRLTGNIGPNPFTIDYGSTVGTLSFDVDTNNDGLMDDDATLNNYWHFDGTTPVPAGKTDFYSIALHELVHAIGFSTGLSWSSNVSAVDHGDWLAPHVVSLLGTGDNVLQSDGVHIAEGLLSTRLSDGETQEAAMDPTLATGTRKSLTRLDAAFLQDINWAVVPEPSSFFLLASAASLALYSGFRRRRTKDR